MSMYESFQTAPEIAYNIILKKILDGEYKPGTRLSRRKMAEVTKVSVIPVIEALKKLEEETGTVLEDSPTIWLSHSRNGDLLLQYLRLKK